MTCPIRRSASSSTSTRDAAWPSSDTIGDPAEGRTRVRHNFLPGRIEGLETRGPEPAPTTALLGRRVLWTYSDEHSYEHVYLGPHSYTWHCLAGPAADLADTDECTTYQIRPGIYVFASRGKVIPCASVTIADHRDITSLRSYGSRLRARRDG